MHNIFRRLLKSRYLRLVNLLGLALIFASLVLSYAYVKHELSYDRFNVNADRIARVMMSWSDDHTTECRVYDDGVDALFRQLPEVEQVVQLSRINTLTFTCNDKQRVVNDIYAASDNFFQVFDYPLVVGDKKTVLDVPNKIAISESLARKLFGNASPIGQALKFANNREIGDATLLIAGVFKDFPDNSHFHTEMILHREKNRQDFAYTYLLFKRKPLEINPIEQKLTDLFNKKSNDTSVKTTIRLMPLTDIHLRSKCSREMEPNGNVSFIYLVVGVNGLLMFIVFLNLWLNAGLIFNSRRRFYQLLRLNGATTTIIVREELLLALVSGVTAMLGGVLLVWMLAPPLSVKMNLLSLPEICVLSGLFLFAVTFVMMLPVLQHAASTVFNNGKIDLRSSGRALPGVRYLLTIQYVVVMLIVIFTFGISKQVSLIMQKQVGGNDSCIIVLKEQPDTVKQRFPLLKAELLKHPEIEAVTAAMQLPGEGIRDGIEVTLEGKSNKIPLHVLVVGDDFVPFLNLECWPELFCLLINIPIDNIFSLL